MQGVHRARVLRVDNVPRSYCPVPCRGCDFDPLPGLRRQDFYPSPADAAARIEARADALDVDLVAIRPHGEATLDRGLGALLDALRPTSRSVVVFTNGTTLHRDDVRRELALADAVCLDFGHCDPSQDASSSPHRVLVDGIRVFSSAFKGPVFTATVVTASTPGYLLDASAEFASTLKPRVAYLVPLPGVTATHLARAKRRFEDQLPHVDIGAPEAGIVESLSLVKAPMEMRKGVPSVVHAVA